DVAMEDAGGVGSCEAIGNSGKQRDNLPPGAPFLLGPACECSAVDELGHEILLAVRITHVMDSKDMRMVERRGHLSLLLKAVASGSIGEDLRQKLDRHWPVELGVDGKKDFAHAASAERPFNAVGSDLCAWLDGSHRRLPVSAEEWLHPITS